MTKMQQEIQNGTQKRTRSARASPAQLTRMLDFFNTNKGLVEGKYQVMNGKDEARKKWVELTNELNVIKGASKNCEQWQVVWRDLKSRTSTKARDLRNAKAATGNKPIAFPNLTEFELRVIGLIGAEYVEGSKDCADSIPEEEDLQEELERGNTSVLKCTPQVPSILMEENSPNNQMRLSDDDKENEDNNGMNSSGLPNNVETDGTGIILESVGGQRPNSKENSQQISTIAVTSYLRGKKRKRDSAYENSTASTTGLNVLGSASSVTSNRTRLAETLNSTREHFRSISQGQADAMMVLANASKVQAEASMMNASAMTEMAKGMQKLADAATLQARNDAERIPVIAKLVQVLENLLPAYLDQ